MEYVLDGGIPQKNQLSLNREICYQKDAINYCQEQSILYSVSYVHIQPTSNEHTDGKFFFLSHWQEI